MKIFYYWCLIFIIVQAIRWFWKVMNKGLKSCKTKKETIISFVVYLIEIVSWVATVYLYIK